MANADSHTHEVRDSLAAALARFQSKLPRIVKDETAQVQGKTKDGTPYSYSYSYADLADLSQAALPLLGGEGLSFTARPTLTEEGRFVLAYSLLHASGDRLDGMYPLPADVPVQTQGSAITYARRYSLCAVTGLAPDAEDDDGQAANQPPPQGWERNTQPSAYDEPPGARPASSDLPATPKQITAIQTMFGKLGIEQGQERRDLVETWIDRIGLESMKDLTRAEASIAFDRLREQLKANGQGQGQAGEAAAGAETAPAQEEPDMEASRG